MPEVQARIDQHMLAGRPIRKPDGDPSGTRVLDLDSRYGLPATAPIAGTSMGALMGLFRARLRVFEAVIFSVHPSEARARP